MEAGGAQTIDAATRNLLERLDFLLRSLDDLERELAAGELTKTRHRQLHDQYTIEAANVIAALERHEHRSVASRPPAPRRRRWLLVVPALGVLALGALVLQRALVGRAPGGTITGNAQVRSSGLATAAALAEAQPHDAQAQLAYADALLEAGETVDALRRFDRAAQLDPTNPVPRAYSGWIIFLAGLTDQALTRLEAAIALDPAYPDAHFFRGMALLRGLGDRDGARAEFEEYLRLLPSTPQRAEVQALIDQLGPPAAPATTAPNSSDG